MTIGSDTKGVYAIAPTPFQEDGRIDEASIDRMVDFYPRPAARGLTVLGIMGEAPKLDAAEALAIVARVVAPGRLPVVVGVSAPGFAAMRTLARAAMDGGAAGVMIAPPPSLRTDDQIVNYFAQAVEAIGDGHALGPAGLPADAHRRHDPERDSPHRQRQSVLRHAQARGLAGPGKISALRRFETEGRLRPLSILTGNGGLFLDFEMERGADGAMTGYAFPDMLVDVVRLFAAGQRDAAHDLFDAHLPFLRYEQQPGIGLAVRKYVLMRRGVIASDAQRKPGSALTPAARAEVDYLLSRLAARDPALSISAFNSRAARLYCAMSGKARTRADFGTTAGFAARRAASA